MLNGKELKEQEHYNRKIRDIGIWGLHNIFRYSFRHISSKSGTPLATLSRSNKIVWQLFPAKIRNKLRYLMRRGVKFINLPPDKMDKIMKWEKADGIYKQGGVSRIDRDGVEEDMNYAKRQKEDTEGMNGGKEERN